MKWVIRSDVAGDEIESLFWNNDDGWTSRAGATVFTDHQRYTLRLPLGGAWEEIEKREPWYARWWDFCSGFPAPK